MDDKQKSRTYFDRHSSTIINRNGYWNYDYRMTSKILKRRNVKKLIDIGCGKYTVFGWIIRRGQLSYEYSPSSSSGKIPEGNAPDPRQTRDGTDQ